ncbi:VOC family protein [Plantactinospora endophytica]|uniref:Glyoxalase n=1 Tax=Plantactinospora endophytica TaxID=673535 RepID=A0ABQ4E782_9ACTN|nr:VOC family protein [Plantactinospora endophytica]GIG90543.1 glyoxalase [Plantactinospora endophytica]
MATTGVRTILYPVRNLAEAKELFTRLAGRGPVADSPYYVGYDLDGQHIGLVPNGHDAQNMTGATAFWHVDDIEASVKMVLDAGGTTQQEIHEVGNGRRVAAVVDAEGNVLGFVQDA